MDRGELDITAELALINLNDDERDKLESAVTQLLEYFSTMDRVDVSGLEPTTHALQEGNRLRQDTPREGTGIADDILEQAPDLEDRFIAIPNVLSSHRTPTRPPSPGAMRSLPASWSSPRTGARTSLVRVRSRASRLQ